MELSKEMKEAIKDCSNLIIDAMDKSWYEREKYLSAGLETLVKQIFEDIKPPSLKVTGIVTPKDA